MDVVLDVLKTVIAASLAVAISTIVPLLFQLRREREEKSKLKAETSSISADAAQKIVQAATGLQDAYDDILAEERARAKGYRQEIDALLVKLKNLQVASLDLQERIKEYTQMLEDAQKEAALQQRRIDGLIAGAEALRNQVTQLGGTPVF